MTGRNRSPRPDGPGPQRAGRTWTSDGRCGPRSIMRVGRACVLLLAMALAAAATADGMRVLVPAADAESACRIETRDASFCDVVERDGRYYRAVRTGTRIDYPGVSLLPPTSRPWDLSGHALLSLEVVNPGRDPVGLYLRIDNEGGDGQRNCLQMPVSQIAPGETRRFVVPLGMTAVPSRPLELRGFKGAIDPRRITQVILFQARPSQARTVLVGDLQLCGPRVPMVVEDFLPFIDAYGQQAHGDWPGRIRNDADLAAAVEDEERDLASTGLPAGWDRFGGWADGPVLEATGHFRTAKIDGRWWLVDPDGRLFWSTGITCVRASCGITRMRGREDYFAPLATDPDLGRFLVDGFINYSAANLRRRHGEAWRERFADLVHRRLRSWRINTIGNWSDDRLVLMRRTPYTLPIETSSRRIADGEDSKMPDPFDQGFAASLDALFRREAGRSADDPWCIGYFVENELPWHGPLLGANVLRCPADQPAKQAAIAQLRAAHPGGIAELNAAWNTTHASWEALLACRAAPDLARAREDLAMLARGVAERFFSTVREARDRHAPRKLLLGSRFAGRTDDDIAIAARHCDVVSFNIYRPEVAGFALPAGLDRPVLIGEFHFGAFDRGPFHPGLVPVTSQAERAVAYRRYVEGAAANPCLVGAHWFQYGDQPTTGRTDGENYQVGFVDICDTPYPETVAAARATGDRIYVLRSSR